MLNKGLLKQTLVAILVAAPALADPPAAHVPTVRGFRDWRLDCTAAPCTIQTRVAGQDGSEILRLEVREGRLLVLSTSLPLYLPDGLGITIAERPDRKVPWWTCGDGGCEARLPLDPDLETSLKREPGGRVTLTLLDGVPVRIGFSLVGFQAASRALAAVSPP